MMQHKRKEWEGISRYVIVQDSYEVENKTNVQNLKRKVDGIHG